MIIDENEIYEHFKNSKNLRYEEEKHCKLLIRIMLDPNKGTVHAYCLEAKITDRTFQKWVRKHELFADIYAYSKMIARAKWEEEGRRLKDIDFPMGTVNHAFEHWKMIGWTRFGISKNSRLTLKLDAQESPLKHYQSILEQASEGEFTAAEFKQLMEAVNVGLNVTQVFELQKQIDELKANLELMTINKNGQYSVADK